MKVLDVILNEAYGVVPGDPIGDVIKQVQTKKQQPAPVPAKKPVQTQPAPAKKPAAPVQPQPVTGTTLENVLRDIAIKAGIVGNELAQFLAQCAHETANFTTLSEFGDSKTFSKYDPKVDPVKAKQLGNIQPGDGERYKGRGYLQITGRYNYSQIGQALGLPLEQKPQMLEDPAIAAQASIWFWKNRVKPKVGNFADTKAVTSVINPSLRGLQQRHGNYKDYISTTSISPEFAVREGHIDAEDLIDIYVRGKFKGRSMTLPVAKAFPNKFLDRVIQKLVDKYNVNPNAIVYGPTKQSTDEELNESKSADLYKGASLDNAEAILASNTMLGGSFNDIGNRPQPELSQSKDDTWAWRRRGAERYLRPSSKIDLNPDTSPEEYEQWKKDVERASKRFPEKRFPSGDYSVSLTRDKNIAYNFTGVDSGVIFVLNQELLARDLGRRLHPYTDIYHTMQTRERGNESEESVIGGIPNVKKYIKRIELVGDKFDPRKYPNLAQYIKVPAQVAENKDIRLIAKHYFPVDDPHIIEKYKMKKDHNGYYLPQWNTSGRVFDAHFTSLNRLYGRPHTLRENFADGRKFVEPNFNFEWEEAERYPEFAKLGKDAWIELAKKGQTVTINSVKGVSNTDAADPDSFKSLVPEKQKRALAQLDKGTVEMPIVAVYSDGHKELIGGNTRLTAMMARDGQATVWAFRVPDNISENFADGKVKGKSRPGRVKRAGASCNGSVTSLRQRAKNASGEKAKMYHWCANMKSGRKK